MTHLCINMKSALTLVLFLLFESCVFGDADKAETVSVIEGDSVTLHTGVTEIRSSDVIEWRMLNVSRIARISGNDASTEGASKDRLKLDHQTGDIMITNIKTTDSGEYKLKIKLSKESSEKIFSVSVVSGVGEVKSVSVTVGDSVTLNSGTNIQRDDVIQWRFADLNSPIAEHNRKTGNFSTSDGPDGIFRHRLQLDYWTGSLTIWKIGTNHSGLYEAGIRKSSSGYTIHKSYSVTVRGERKSALSVKKGDDVTLHTGLTEIHTDDLMLWMFEDTVIAEIIKAQKQVPRNDDVPDGRFRDRLKLDKKTGNLTITNTRTEDSGLYELKIISSRFTINKRITVIVTEPGLSAGAKAGIVLGVVVGLLLACAVAAAVVIYYRRKISEIKARLYKWRTLSVMEGERVTLNLDDTKVHKDDKLLWMFRSSRIAERKTACHIFTVHDDKPDGRFRGRLQLNDQTGSLTITHTKTTDTGVYELLIIRPGKNSIKRFSVSVFAKTEIKTVSVKEGESVKLESGVFDMENVDEILWTCGLDTPLAEIKGGTKKISPLVDQIFEGRLELDLKTGSLTIKNSKRTDAGIYMVYDIEEGNISTNLIRVEVSDLTDNRNNSEEKSVRINNSEDVPLTTVYG